MHRKLVVERDLRQTRVALFEADKLVEVHVETAAQGSVVGNIYKGKVKRVLPGMQAAFLGIGLDRDAFLYAGDAVRGEPEAPADNDNGSEGSGVSSPPPIETLLNLGEELLVQVKKEPLAQKGARVTTQIALAGLNCHGHGEFVTIQAEVSASHGRAYRIPIWPFARFAKPAFKCMSWTRNTLIYLSFLDVENSTFNL